MLAAKGEVIHVSPPFAPSEFALCHICMVLCTPYCCCCLSAKRSHPFMQDVKAEDLEGPSPWNVKIRYLQSLRGGRRGKALTSPPLTLHLSPLTTTCTYTTYAHACRARCDGRRGQADYAAGDAPGPRLHTRSLLRAVAETQDRQDRGRGHEPCVRVQREGKGSREGRRVDMIC